MEKVKKMVAAGATMPAAIKDALAQAGVKSVAEFAIKHELRRASVSSQLNGSAKLSDDTIGALIADLGGTEIEWRELAWLASKPAKATA